MTDAQIRASAPGKLFLLGEYAVLRGAPAIISAVDRRVRVSLKPSVDGQWRLSAPQLDLSDAPLPLDSASRDPRTAMVRELLTTLADAGVMPAPQHMLIDSGEFFEGKEKLGLGSSAAVMAALLQALIHLKGEALDPTRAFALCHEAHSRAQGKRGSGGDIATSLLGGTIEFRREQPAQPLHMPDDLDIVCVRAGKPAATAAFIARYEAARTAGASQLAEVESRLDALARDGLAAWRRLDTGRFIAIAGDYGQAMGQLGTCCGLPVAGESFDRLDHAAGRLGGSYKPSGAGGGDVGLMFLPSGIPATRLDEALARADAVQVPLSLRSRAAGIDPLQPPGGAACDGQLVK